MPSAVEPGTRLARRYRLLEAVAVLGGGATADGTAYWCAEDEALGRPVGVRVLPAGAPRAGAVLGAARRAATVDDRRFLAVLDADRSDGLAYVVTEWCAVTSLADLVARGPLPAGEAEWLAAEVARGLAAAHAAGLAHRRLVPEAVLRSDSGQVKVTGLAVDAALCGLNPGVDPEGEAADVRAAGGVLYAALTGRWPLPTSQPLTVLPPAPVLDGTPCAPRQVRAAVPASLDELACRALAVPRRRGSAPIRSAAQLAQALPGSAGAGVEPGRGGTAPLPAVPHDASPGSGHDGEPDPDDRVPLLATRAGPGRAGRAAAVAVAALLALGVGLLTWQVVGATGRPARTDAGPAPSASAGAPTPRPTQPPPGTELPVVRAVDFDPEGSDGEENPESAAAAIDGDPDTAWTTEQYYNSPLGGLKSGVGLLLDLGEVRQTSTVTLELVGRGSDVQLRVAPGTRAPKDADGFDVVASAEGVGSLVTLRPDEPVRGRYLLVWFTTLPPSGEDRYRGGITSVVVRS